MQLEFNEYSADNILQQCYNQVASALRAFIKISKFQTFHFIQLNNHLNIGTYNTILYKHAIKMLNPFLSAKKWEIIACTHFMSTNKSVYENGTPEADIINHIHRPFIWQWKQEIRI